MTAAFGELGGIVVRKHHVKQFEDALLNAAKQYSDGDDKKRKRLMTHIARVVEAFALRSKEGLQECCGFLEHMLDILVSTDTDTDLAVQFKTLETFAQSADEHRMRTSVAVAKVLENQGMGKEPLLVDPFKDILSNQTGMATVLSMMDQVRQLQKVFFIDVDKHDAQVALADAVRVFGQLSLHCDNLKLSAEIRGKMNEFENMCNVDTHGYSVYTRSVQEFREVINDVVRGAEFMATDLKAGMNQVDAATQSLDEKQHQLAQLSKWSDASSFDRKCAEYAIGSYSSSASITHRSSRWRRA